jgi:REP element-mobilizing transposase RayT
MTAAELDTSVERTLQRARTIAQSTVRGTSIATRWTWVFMPPKRLPEFSYRGEYEYSLTCCTFARRRLFTAPSLVTNVCTQLLKSTREDRFEVSAYCFMPDHVHVLVRGTSEASDLRHFVHGWKQQTGHAHKQSTGVRLWQVRASFGLPVLGIRNMFA